MGFTTLFCVITFNLALSHHLKALLREMQSTKRTKKKSDRSRNHDRTSLIHSTAQLYELAGNTILSSCDEGRGGGNSRISASTFQRFNTILCNNLNDLNQMISSSNDNTRRLLSSSFADTANNELMTTSPTFVTATPNPVIESHDELERSRSPKTSPKRLSSSSPSYRLRSFGSISYDDNDLEFEYYSTKDLQDDDRVRQFFNEHTTTTTLVPMKDASSGGSVKSKRKAMKNKTTKKTTPSASSLPSSPPPSSSLRSIIRRVTSKENLLGLIAASVPGASSDCHPKTPAVAAAAATDDDEWSKENARNNNSSSASLLTSYSSSSSSFRSSIVSSIGGSKRMMSSSNSTLCRISSTENLLRRVTSTENLLGMF